MTLISKLLNLVTPRYSFIGPGTSFIGPGTLMAVCLATGCSSSEGTYPQSNTTRSVSSSSAESILMVLAEGLGVDPKELGEPGSPDEIVTTIERSLAARGEQLRSVTPSEYIRFWKDGRRGGGILTDAKRSFALAVVGVAEENSGPSLQVLSRQGEPALTGLANRESDYSIFLCRPLPATAHDIKSRTIIPMSVGSGEISLDKLMHHFGDTNPLTAVSTQFLVKNSGTTNLHLGQPRSSCGCLASVLQGNEYLGPGEERSIRADLELGKSPRIVHSVVLPISDRATGIRRPIKLTLFANQRNALEFIPKQIDFGVVYNQGPVVSRTVRISEVESDRFDIIDVTTSELAIAHNIDVQQRVDGLKDYLVQLRFQPRGLEPGRYQERFVIKTTSQLIPRLVVPIEFRVNARMYAEQSTLSFGDVQRGALARVKTRLVSEMPRDLPAPNVTTPISNVPDLAAANLTATVIDSPNRLECEIRPESTRSEAQLIISGHFQTTGIINDVVELRLQSGDQSRDIEIRCVGYVRP